MKMRSVLEELPPEGVVVETVSESGLVQPLKRSGSLWFVPSGAMYVYYNPVAWAYREGEE